MFNYSPHVLCSFVTPASSSAHLGGQPWTSFPCCLFGELEGKKRHQEGNTDPERHTIACPREPDTFGTQKNSPLGYLGKRNWGWGEKTSRVRVGRVVGTLPQEWPSFHLQ